ncbi:MAG: Flp pilus assembly complex ATPase component TadA [Armatimonadetes bacterium]|nr:Flp pilus assembly complex ATPase component TadA [Armatimonadota bacterium]
MPELSFVEDCPDHGRLSLGIMAALMPAHEQTLDPEVVRSVPEHLIMRYQVVPLEICDNILRLGMADPTNQVAIDDVRLITGYDIEPVPMDPESFQASFQGAALVFTHRGELDLRSKLPLQETRVYARVTGPLASVQVSQRFANPHSEPIEAIYLFPVPESAAVHEFRMVVGHRVIEGRIQEKRQAQATYQEGKRTGHRAALLEMGSDNVLQVRVGNLPPGEQVTVELGYVERLEMSVAEIAFRLPTVVAPRYRSQPELESPRQATRASLALRVDLETGGLLPSYLGCSQHAVKLSLPQQGLLRVELSNDHETLDRDFILRFRTEVDQPRALLLATEEHFMLSVLPPVFLETQSRARDVVLLVDRSGSMQGVKMQSAQRAVTDFLRRLGPGDRFSLIAFDDKVERFQDGRWCSAAAPEAAIDWVKRLYARGGTEVVKGIQDVLAMPGEEGRLLCCVLITDGQVGNEQAIYRALEAGEPRARFFTLGIDTAVNDAFLRQMARLGRGTCELVTPGGELEAALDRLARETGAAVLTDLRLADRGLHYLPESLAPERLPDLFAARPVLIMGRKLEMGGGGVELSARLGASDWSATVAAHRSCNPALAILWARERVRSLEDRLRLGDQGAEAEIVGLALQHRLLTKYTSFVLVDRAEVVNPEGTERTVVQPSETPAGWSLQSILGTTDLLEVEERVHEDWTGAFAPEETVKDISAQEFGPLEYEDEVDEEIALDKLKELVDEAPIVRVVNLILSTAIDDGASHVHIEPEARSLRVRFRVDGVLHDVMSPPKHIQAPLISRIKIMAGLDIAVREVPQGGTFTVNHFSRTLRLRVSTCPTTLGEKLVLTLEETQSPAWDELGLPPAADRALQAALERRSGLVVVAGLARSGMRDVLRACAARLRGTDRSVVLWDDDVADSLGVTHVRLWQKAEACLSAQDLDVVVAGPNDDRLGTLARLTQSGVLAVAGMRGARCVDVLRRLPGESNLQLILAQTRLRRACQPCGMKGCDRCQMCGFRGQVSLYETWLPTQDGLRAFERGEDLAYLTTFAQQAGPLLASGQIDPRELAQAGIEPIQEGDLFGPSSVAWASSDRILPPAGE